MSQPSDTDEARINRRAVLLAVPGTTLACESPDAPASGKAAATEEAPVQVKQDVVTEVFRLGTPPWRTFDPFLFCVHHDDAYPAGNDALGPAASLAGRNMGMDFEGKEGWRMYHGEVVPGFPRHPHRGFETVTVARRGYIDHSDSLGATARYGLGDVQWMTAGAGIVHAEMFPLLDKNADNPAELFQIWLNLPREDKFVAPYFSMFWNHTIPVREHADERGKKTEIKVIAGTYDGANAPAPPPNSWAARKQADVAIWTLRLAPDAVFSLPPASEGANRVLYYFRGKSLEVASRKVEPGFGVVLRSDREATLINGPEESEILMLQGRPIGEPVVQYGPFVMNTRQEIQQAYDDYRRTRFGGWPWKSDDPVHVRDAGRFAIHADGRKERA